MADRSTVAALAAAARHRPAGDPDEVALRLTDVESEFLLARWFTDAPTSHQVRRTLRRMSESAERLLDRLEDANARAAIRHVGIAIIENAGHPDFSDIADRLEMPTLAAAAARDVAQWARDAEMLERRRANKKKGHTGDEPAQRLIDGLAAVWRDHWDRAARVSVNPITDQIGGPFVRFVQGFVRDLRARISPLSRRIDPGVDKALASLTAEKIRRLTRRSRKRKPSR